MRGKTWTIQEDEQLLAFAELKTPYQDMANILDRSESAIENRLRKLRFPEKVAREKTSKAKLSFGYQKAEWPENIWFGPRRLRPAERAT